MSVLLWSQLRRHTLLAGLRLCVWAYVELDAGLPRHVARVRVDRDAQRCGRVGRGVLGHLYLWCVCRGWGGRGESDRCEGGAEEQASVSWGRTDPTTRVGVEGKGQPTTWLGACVWGGGMHPTTLAGDARPLGDEAPTALHGSPGG